MADVKNYIIDDVLRGAAEAASKLDGISDALERVELTREVLVERMLRAAELQQSAETAIADLAQERERAWERIRAMRPEHDKRREESKAPGPVAVAVVFLISLTVLQLILLGAGYLLGPVQLLESFNYFSGYVWWIQPIYWAPIAVIGLAAVLLRATRIVRWPVIIMPWRRAELAKEIEAMNSALEAENARVAQLTSQIEMVLAGKVMQPIALQILESETSPTYEMTLPTGSATPLGEVFDPRFETSTDARTHLESLFAAMSGGSIGLSGPRGVGKSTLINHFCRRGVGRVLKDKPVLAFATPAPARYESRDFALHLFASLCEAVYAAKGRRPQRSGPTRTGGAVLNHPLVRLLLPYGQATLMAGMGLLVYGVGGGLILKYVTADWLASFKSVAATLARALDLKISTLLYFGIALSVLGGLLDSIRRQISKDDKRESDSEVESDELLRSASGHLDMIQFQRSYTSGWSGTLTFPVGAATTATEAQTFAERQASLPEIIDRYSAFVREIVPNFTLIVGIDELDKMKSDEDAERFLNDNKVLFGQEGCFYLVSVSESALAKFERRGLPIRDVFDSSFDEVIHVGYLDTAQSIRLLRRRVAALPVPFACLCLVLAGGLPRDLIRTCRTLFLTADEKKDRYLTSLSKMLFEQDFKRKCRGLMLSAKQLDADGVSGFLLELSRIERQGLSTAALDREAVKLARQRAPEEPSDDDKRLVGLYGEFASYLLYLSTVLAFFERWRSEGEIRTAVNDGAFDSLAQARQSLSVDPKLAWNLSLEFRRKILPEILPVPEAPVPAIVEMLPLPAAPPGEPEALAGQDAQDDAGTGRDDTPPH